MITLALVLRLSFNKQSISIQLSNQYLLVTTYLLTLGSRTFQNMLWIPFCLMRRPGENLTVPDPNQKGTDTSFNGGLGKVFGEVFLLLVMSQVETLCYHTPRKVSRNTPQAE